MEEHPFAPVIRTLGRGPGRSRALTRDEARDALECVLDGRADPYQVGAFLMLLRYRGEDPDEVAGLVEAARAGTAGEADAIAPDLDWPSYGSGRTRGAPWYLLAALALGQAGHRVLMHGSNEFTGGITVERALAVLGRAPARDRGEARQRLGEDGFAYLPLGYLAPELERLLGLRHLLGLRSPINTVGRLLDPFDAGRSVDGVFHPPYVSLHLDVAERLGRERLVVLKGGGGEAERAPGKPVAVHLLDRRRGRSVLELPPLGPRPAPAPPAHVAPADEADPLELFASVWTGAATPPGPVATVIGTIALGLLALDPERSGADADRDAERVWHARSRP